MPSDLYAERLRIVTGSMAYTVSAVAVVDPNGVVTEPSGSLVRTQDGRLWMNTDGASAWILAGPTASGLLVSGSITGTLDASFGRNLNVGGSITGALDTDLARDLRVRRNLDVDGQATGSYILVDPGSTGAGRIEQIIVRAGNSGSAGILVTGPDSSNFCFDAEYTSVGGVGWVAKDTTAMTFAKFLGRASIYGKGSLTPGSAFSFSEYFSVDLRNGATVISGSLSGTLDAQFARKLTMLGGGTGPGIELTGSTNAWLNIRGPQSTVPHIRFQTTSSPSSNVWDIRLPRNTDEGEFSLHDVVNNAQRFLIDPRGKITLWNDAAVGKSLVVTGSITGSGDLQVAGKALFGVSPFGYTYILNDEVNGAYNTNTGASLYLNYHGYQGGTTQFRDLSIRDGKTSEIALFSGSTKQVIFRADNQTLGSITGSGDATFGRNVGLGNDLTVGRLLTVTTPSTTIPVIRIKRNAGNTQHWGFGHNDSTQNLSTYWFDGTNWIGPFMDLDPTGSLYVSGNLRSVGSLTGSGDAYFNRDVTVDRNLTVTGDDQRISGSKVSLGVVAGYSALSSSGPVYGVNVNVGGNYDTTLFFGNTNGIYATAKGVRNKGANALWNFGITGEASGSEGDSLNIGVTGKSIGTGTNAGIYGQAYGGQTNYGGFFEGYNPTGAPNPAGARSWAIWATGTVNIIGDLYVTGTIFGGIAGGGVTGTGTARRLPRWSAAAILTDSNINDPGSGIEITGSITGTLDMQLARNLSVTAEITGSRTQLARTKIVVGDNFDGLVIGTAAKQWGWYPVSSGLRLWEYTTVVETGLGADRITIVPGGGTTFAAPLTASQGISTNALTGTQASFIERATAKTASDLAAVRGWTTGTINTVATNVQSYGVHGISSAGRSTGSNFVVNYGVYGQASNGTLNFGGRFETTGSASINIGVYGSATGAGTNYGVYSSGKLYSDADLEVVGSITGSAYALAGGATPARLWIGRQTFKTAGAATYTPTVGTKAILVKMVGAGGGGGGWWDGINGGVGGGGAAGCYFEKFFTSVTSATGSVNIGTGGTGGDNATGGSGGDTVFAINTVTYIAKGGAGGLKVQGYNQCPGGFPLSGTSGGDVNYDGQAGFNGVYLNMTAPSFVGWGGAGGSSAFGAGGGQSIATAGAGSSRGKNPTGFGSGGGGGIDAIGNATHWSGSQGAGGLVIIDEYG